MKRLNDNVWVDGVEYHAGCRPPDDIAARIGAHAWEDGEPSVQYPGAPSVVDRDDQADELLSASVADEPPDGEMPEVDDDPPDDDPADALQEDAAPVAPHRDLTEPPRVGRGASRAAWADYASTAGVDVTDAMSRDDIIAAVDNQH